MSQHTLHPIHDRPNSYIGRTVPRPNLRRLVSGQGRYLDDIRLPRMGHLAFVRSPYAHAVIEAIDVGEARAMPGVIAVVTGPEMAKVCTPWIGVLTHLEGLKSQPQYPLAMDKACWQGEPVVAIVATSRALAEDAAERVRVEWRELPAVADMETALDARTPVIHADLGDNLAWKRHFEAGEVDAAFAGAAVVVEETFDFGRHTGVTVEPRAIISHYEDAERRLTVHHSHQAPHMMQDIFAKHFGLEDHDVRVICPDVGGSYGIKVHTYPDEMAAVALSIMLKRPVKFVADRLESFVSDIHARDHRIRARMAVDAEGHITAIEMDDVTGIGPYSVYPRTSGIEANQIVNLTGAQYTCRNYRADARVVFQNKVPMCQYRAVGHPIATAVTEGLVDMAAAALDLDPVEMRRRNLLPDDGYPAASPVGLRFEALSHHRSLDTLISMMDYDALRREQAELRARGIYRGIGIATFIELTNPSAMFYGVGGARISAQDGCTLRLDARGNVICLTGVTEQGQGAEAVLAQVTATAVGVPLEKVRVITGDTDVTPYGGGTWASRGAGVGGEAAVQAGHALRQNILQVAGIVLQADPANLDIQNATIVDAADGRERIGLDEVARIAYFRADTLPKDFQSELTVTRHYVPKEYPFAFTNGVQASLVEVDPDTGFVTLLNHWAVEDCGTVLNPQLVDEQVRGGIVQGIGAALFEHCMYDADGQLLNGSMADYLVPMSAEMPDIQVAHVETPTKDSELGAKGAGEAGTAGAPAAVLNAINDALRPLTARLNQHPATPERILRALGSVS
jgi:carbon-monoxide dehydrogenase large subunit